MTPTSSPRERGSAPVDFVLLGSLVILLFLAVLQVAIDFHVRDVLAACASDGARYGANADVRSAQAGAEKANDEIRAALGPSFASAYAPDSVDVVDGAPVVTVAVRVRLPLLAWFLPEGPTVTAVGHALQEP